MIVKTSLLIFAILSYVGKSKGLMDFKDFDVEVIFENYNLTCYIGINRYIQQKLYDPRKSLKPTDKAYIEKIQELTTTYFNLLRVYYIQYVENNKVNTIIAPTMWTEYLQMLDWNSKENEIKMQQMASKMIDYICGNQFTMSDVQVIRIYENCKLTLNSLSVPSHLMKKRLTDLFTNHAREHVCNEMLLDVKRLPLVPVPMDYGFILLLIKTDEIENFFQFNPIHQKIFIINLMDQAIINTYDTIIQIYKGLKVINDEMSNILKEIHLILINVTESVLNIQGPPMPPSLQNKTTYEQRQRTHENIQKILRTNKSKGKRSQMPPSLQNKTTYEQRQNTRENIQDISSVNKSKGKGSLHEIPKEVDLSSDATEQPKPQSELIDMYLNYIQNLEAILNSKRLEFENNYLSIYSDYMNGPERKEDAILINNMRKNEYYELLMEIRVWLNMIKKFADKMKADMIKNKNVIEHPDLKYLTEMKKLFQNHRETIKQYK